MTKPTKCALCKKADVPKHELPQDPRWPVLCDGCLRTYTAPGYVGGQATPSQEQK